RASSRTSWGCDHRLIRTVPPRGGVCHWQAPPRSSAWLPPRPCLAVFAASAPSASRCSLLLRPCLAAFAASAPPPPRVYPQPPALEPARHHLCAAGKSDKVG